MHLRLAFAVDVSASMGEVPNGATATKLSIVLSCIKAICRSGLLLCSLTCVSPRRDASACLSFLQCVSTMLLRLSMSMTVCAVAFAVTLAHLAAPPSSRTLTSSRSLPSTPASRWHGRALLSHLTGMPSRRRRVLRVGCFAKTCRLACTLCVAATAQRQVKVV